MFLTHSNALYSKDTTLIPDLEPAQYGHMVSDGGMAVKKGIHILPTKLVEMLLQSQDQESLNFIQNLLAYPKLRVGFILAAGGTVWTGFIADIQRTEHYPYPKIYPLGLSQIAAGQLANKLGSFEYIGVDSASCISGHSAWFTAQNLIGMNHLDACVVATVDNGLSEEYLQVFAKQGLSKLASEEDSDLVKFRLGQGCHIAVLESSESYFQTQNHPLAKIWDLAVACEPHGNPMGISPNGVGYRKVASIAEDWELEFIKTHSTFSTDNEIEEKILNRMFPGVPHLNYKLEIGHTMGAATAVETHLALEKATVGKTFLSMGAGMGNVFSAALVEKM